MVRGNTILYRFLFQYFSLLLSRTKPIFSSLDWMPWINLFKSKGKTICQCVSQATVLISGILDPMQNRLTAEHEVKNHNRRIKTNLPIHEAGDHVRKRVATPDFMHQHKVQIKEDKHLCLHLKCLRFSDIVVISVLLVSRETITRWSIDSNEVIYTKLWDSREKNDCISISGIKPHKVPQLFHSSMSECGNETGCSRARECSFH